MGTEHHSVQIINFRLVHLHGIDRTLVCNNGTYVNFGYAAS